MPIENVNGEGPVKTMLRLLIKIMKRDLTKTVLRFSIKIMRRGLIKGQGIPGTLANFYTTFLARYGCTRHTYHLLVTRLSDRSPAHGVDVFVVHSGALATITTFVTEIETTTFEFYKPVISSLLACLFHKHVVRSKCFTIRRRPRLPWRVRGRARKATPSVTSKVRIRLCSWELLENAFGRIHDRPYGFPLHSAPAPPAPASASAESRNRLIINLSNNLRGEIYSRRRRCSRAARRGAGRAAAAASRDVLRNSHFATERQI
ncbi:hypothetical protein EVAR_41167_1 [Eumeta japonica]|uniref:Uncharacterized protein n=1 Tax=Eumeta variegata TaxID=151549 RepID=A0A4C1YD42_EUMVA|nr:hypothetical protein EVAR_41167_1 [Eumeta japonica]